MVRMGPCVAQGGTQVSPISLPAYDPTPDPRMKIPEGKPREFKPRDLLLTIRRGSSTGAGVAVTD